MPNTKSAKKDLIQSKQKAARNRRVKSTIKSLTKKLEKAMLDQDDKNIKELVVQVQKAIDKAVKKKILKKNTASRKKSRLMKKLNTTKKK